MYYMSSDYGKTWHPIAGTENYTKCQELIRAIEKAGYATKYVGHPPSMAH